MTSPMSSWPLSFRRFFSADRVSLKTMVSVARREPQPLVLSVRNRTVAKVLSIGLVVRRWTHPRIELGGEVVERQQLVAVLLQARDGLGVLRLVDLDEAVEGFVGLLAARGHPDLMDAILRLRLQPLGQLVEHAPGLAVLCTQHFRGAADAWRGTPAAALSRSPPPETPRRPWRASDRR